MCGLGSKGGGRGLVGKKNQLHSDSQGITSTAHTASKPTIVSCAQLRLSLQVTRCTEVLRGGEANSPGPRQVEGSLASVSMSVGAYMRATLAFCPPPASDIQ